MTREEATARFAEAFKALPGPDCFAHQWLRAFETLGMLKLDDQQDVVREEALAALQKASRAYQHFDYRDAVACLYRNGFKIVKQ
jgi:hypothetical protein